MVSIKETQYQKGNNESKQERIIEYSSWEDYCNNVARPDGMKFTVYPSLPRQTKPYNIVISEDVITFQFMHRVLNDEVAHYGELIVI